jgi:hypothetical protein
MALNLHRWIRIALFNLLLVATIGVILRYKIAFSLPFVDQKHLLHGHSHFAFSGWVSQILMVLMIDHLSGNFGEKIYTRYRWVLYANLITAYGMLLTFPVQGYGLFSIIFSTLSIFVSYAFAVMCWKDLTKSKVTTVSHLWFKAALLFNAISSLGAFSLAIMMATKNLHQNWYLAAVYFFLHFQYNGWFFFACMGLITEKLFPRSNSCVLKKIFRLFAGACVPAYLLSTLWMQMPLWIYLLVVIAAFAQIAGWIWMIRVIKPQMAEVNKKFSVLSQWLLGLSAIAMSLKFLLQLASTIPSLSTLTFGFRPVVIGYLHLVLLGCITLFILGYIFANKLIVLNKNAFRGVIIFTSGIFINEALLMIQGISAMEYINVPFINELLLSAAVILFTGLVVLNISQKNFYKADLNHKNYLGVI